MLDEQLSRDIDQALTKANVHPMPTIAATPDPPKPGLTFTWPSWTQLPPSPPQLPILDLGNLDLNNFPYPTAAKWKPPLTPPPAVPAVPMWCPYIPALMHSGGWNGVVPRFTDLSSLPERRKYVGHDPSWRLPAFNDCQPKKQSRFFPALTSSISTPVVKLPPAGCALPCSAQTLQDPSSTAWTTRCARRLLPYSSQRNTYVDTGTTTEDAVEEVPIGDHRDSLNASMLQNTRLASAANLWRILDDNGHRTNAHIKADDRRTNNRVPSWAASEDSGGVPVFPVSDQLPNFDGKETPYDQQKSLIGHANGTDQYHTSVDQNLLNSAMYLAEFFATPRAATPLCELPAKVPYTPSSPTLHMLEVVEYPRAHKVRPQSETETSNEMTKSAEHFTSEQDLFKPEEVLVPKNRSEIPVELATFLSMGHVKNCWCHDCTESPELIEKEELADESEDWLDWSTIGDDSADLSMASAPQTVTVESVSDVDECEFARRPCANASEWDDLFPSSSEQEVKPDPETMDEFLGYYHDGPAFAHDTDYDWVWAAS